MSPHFLDSFAWLAERLTDILRKRFTTISESLSQSKSVSVLGSSTSYRDLLGFLAVIEAQVKDPEGFRILIAPTQTLAAEVATWCRWATVGLENAPEVVLQGSRQGFPKETAGKLFVMSARRFTCFEADGHFETTPAKTVLFWDTPTTTPAKTHKADIAALRHWIMEAKAGVTRLHLSADKNALHLSRPIIEAPAMSVASTFTVAFDRQLPYGDMRALGILGPNASLANLKAENTIDDRRYALADHFARADVKAWSRGVDLTLLGTLPHVIDFTHEEGALEALDRVVVVGLPECAESLLLALTTLPTGVPVTFVLEEDEADDAWDALCEELDVRAHWVDDEGNTLTDYLGRAVRAKLSVKANYVPKPLSAHREDAIVFEDSDAPVRLRERLDTPESILPGRATRTTKRREDSTLTGRKAQRKPAKGKANAKRTRNGNVEEEAPRRRRKTEEASERTDRRSAKGRKTQSRKTDRTERLDANARNGNRKPRNAKATSQERRQPRRNQPDPLSSASAIGIYHESPSYPMGMTDSMLGTPARAKRTSGRASSHRSPKHASAVDAYLNSMDSPMTLSLPQETPGLDFMGEKKRKPHATKPARGRTVDGNRAAPTRGKKGPNPKRKPRKVNTETTEEALQTATATADVNGNVAVDEAKPTRDRKKPFRQKSHNQKGLKGNNRRNQNRRNKNSDDAQASVETSPARERNDVHANDAANQNLEATSTPAPVASDASAQTAEKPRRHNPKRRPMKKNPNRSGQKNRRGKPSTDGTPTEKSVSPIGLKEPSREERSSKAPASVSDTNATSAPSANATPKDQEGQKKRSPRNAQKRRPMKPRRAPKPASDATPERGANEAPSSSNDTSMDKKAAPKNGNAKNGNNPKTGAKSNPRRQGRGRYLRGRINAKHREKSDAPSEG